MGLRTAEASLTEHVWETLEANLSEGNVPPLRVLFATDESEPAQVAESFLARLPLPSGSAVCAVTVLDAQDWQVPDSLKGAEQEWGRRVGEAAGTRLARRGVQSTHAAPRGAPAAEILRAANIFNANLIVVGASGHSRLQRFVLGSVAENVAKHAKCPVLVARAPTHGLRRVVLAVDGSDHACRAARVAGHFPLPGESEITVCHVVRPYTPLMGPEYHPDIDQFIWDIRKQQQQDAEQLVQTVRKQLEQWGKHTACWVGDGDPATEILKLAEEQNADLVIAGARGMSAIGALIVGSVADRLLTSPSTSVLLVH